MQIPLELSEEEFSLLITSQATGEYAWFPSTTLAEQANAPEIRLAPGTIVEVIVESSSGIPVADHPVSVGIQGWQSSVWFGRTDSRGTVVIEGVPPSMNLWVGNEDTVVTSGEVGAFVQFKVVAE